MRLLPTVAAALLLSTFTAFSYSPAVREINIGVKLQDDGTALVSERWDVCVASGTEWYLVRSNLGDIGITGLSVSDETGLTYIDEGKWDVDRSIEEKAGRCGIVQKPDGGAEICWGVGSYGDHIFNVSYSMTNAVKTLSDYDMLHIQFVSPGLSAAPEHVKVTVEAAPSQLDTTNTRAWGFGYVGTTTFADGKIVFESDEQFVSNSSVIALLRFNKGIFNSPSVQDRTFGEVLSTAMEGADFGEEEEGEGGNAFWILLTILMMVSPIIIGVVKKSIETRQILGCKMSEIDWQRDIPMNGDLVASDYVLTRLGDDRKNNALASALILRMIYKGQLKVSKNADGKIDISFDDAKTNTLDETSRGLYDMMKSASGDDVILQGKEFSRWSRSHKSRVSDWASSISSNGMAALSTSSNIIGTKFTVAGQAKARGLLGFKKYLDDFTLIAERESTEAILWQEYLVFGALFGIADKVAKQLQDIDPRIFDETMQYDYPTLGQIIILSNVYGNSIVNASTPTGSSSGGFGGFGGGSSFGGGGGFSGGGFGGGSR